MRKWLALSAALLIAALSCLAQAQAPNVRAVIFPPRSASGFTPSCSQSTAWLARATNVTLTFDKQRYDDLICGLVTDGVWAKLDAMWVFVAPDVVTAVLNLVSSSFALTKTGTVTFTAYAGVVGDASTGFYSTSYNPSVNGVNWTLNTAAFGSCQSNIRTTGQNWASMGFNAFARLLPNFNGTIAVVSLNAGQFTPSASNSQGLTVVDRSAAAVTNYYVNGVGGPNDTTATNAVQNQTVFILAENNAGTAQNFSGDTIAIAFVGGSLGALESNLQTRVNTYMSAYSVSGC